MRILLGLLLLFFAVPVAFGFTDTVGYEWERSIGYLEDSGIVQGYADGSFKSNAKINRAEFSKIVIEGLFATEEYAAFTKSCFPDVPGNAWMTPYICFAKDRGILSGHPDGSFHPADTINQAEALKILLLAFDVELSSASGEWYQTYLATARELGMLYFAGGNEGAYRISRGEMAYFTAWLLAQRGSENTVDQLHKVPAYVAPFSYRIDGDTHVVIMSAKDVDMRIVSGHDSIRPKECDFPHHCVAEAQAESFGSYRDRLSGKLLINGPFFDAYSVALNGSNYHQIASDLVINGKMESMYGWDSSFGDGGLLAELNSGAYALYYPVRNWLEDASEMRDGISNYPLVLRDGQVRTKEEIGMHTENDAKFWVSGRRGGLGLSADGTRIIYVNTVGTVSQLGEQLRVHGAASGFALDAGGSNAMEFDSKVIFTPGRSLTTVIEFSER